MITCPSCGQENPPDARFCNACATPLPVTAHGLIEERKVVTVLFVDLVGFTSRAERLDPEDVRAVLTPYFARVRGEIETYGGVVEKFIGDAVMAVFGAPLAHGDDPERAVRAALSIRDAVAELNAADADLDLQLRIAVNTGEALVALTATGGEGMVAGDVANTASRVQEAAPVNGILVGEETYRSTRSVIRYQEADAVVAKGKAVPVRVWQALSASRAPGERAAGRAPLIGRESELGLLEGLWRRAMSERRPQLVTLFGPAGIGKTRLATEFGQRAVIDGARVIYGRSLPYGEIIPYAAFVAHVKQVAGIFDTDDSEEASEKLERAVAKLLGAEAGDTAAHLAMLIGVGEGGEAERQALFFAARRFVEALAIEQPSVLVFEDIHWADGGMLDLLEVLSSRVREAPLLLLAQARPELLEHRPHWGGGLPGYTALPLDALSREHANELASSVLGDAARDAEEVVAAGEGNPLFIEELATSLAEETARTGELPTSIRAIVSARLDALPPGERAVMLDAAVLGKVFWAGGLELMTSGTLPLAELLDSLEGRDLIRREPVSRLSGQQQFSFKHDLIREVAYATLPRQQRRKRHAQAAAFLEEATSEIHAAASALAHHWLEAGENRRALDYYLVAGDQAGRGWAKEQAMQYYELALGLTPEDDRQLRREVAKRYAVAAQATQHLPEMLAGRGAPRSAENRPE